MLQTESKILISGLKFPEGPMFDFERNLWFVEIEGGNLSRWDGNTLDRFDVDGTPNGAMLDKQGVIWFCDSGRREIRTFDVSKNKFQTICSQTSDGKHLKRPNDLIFDAKGNLLFSDHADGREEPISTICVLPKGEKYAKVISDGKFFTNGLALMKDASTLIFAETYNQQLWIADWNDTSLLLNNERMFAKAGNGPWGPDGIAFDDNENLYVTVFNENRINIYNKTGELKNWFECEGSRPTSCTFDFYNRYGLVVTEADRGEILSYPQLKNGLSLFYG